MFWILSSVGQAILLLTFWGRINTRRLYLIEPHNKVLYQIQWLTCWVCSVGWALDYRIYNCSLPQDHHAPLQLLLLVDDSRKCSVGSYLTQQKLCYSISLTPTTHSQIARSPSTNSSRVCWAAAMMTQQGFAESGSLHDMYTKGELSVWWLSLLHKLSKDSLSLPE